MVDVSYLRDYIARIALEVADGVNERKGTGVCVGYNPAIYAVRLMLVPHMIETGWVPIAALHVGDGHGIVVGPKVGDPEKLDGTVFDVHFDGGDPDTLVAHHRHFSNVEPPPVAQSGEMIFKHATGTMTKFFADGTHQLTHATGATETWDAQGNKIVDALARNVLTMAGGMKDDTPKKIVSGVLHIASDFG